MAIPIIAPHHLASVFGILGITVSSLVYLAPLLTFLRIYKNKSTQEFHSVPYVVALFSAMLMLYYAFVKGENTTLIYTINSVGCAIEGTYITMYMIYASKEAKMYTAKLLILLNMGVYGLIILLTMSLSHGKRRAIIVGWICAVFSVCIFASPLSVMAPNILGFIFGIGQMILYGIYKDARRPEVKPKEIQVEVKLEDIAIVEIKLSTTIDDKVDEEEKPKEATKMVIEKVGNGSHV
ncbi:hypothetical protein Ancab_040655 [Ancistrocladus abbreviatus]